jgi:hypothetical protein
LFSLTPDRLDSPACAQQVSNSGQTARQLRMTTSYVGNRSWLRTLLQNEAGATERLTEDMQRYALKRDGIRHWLATEEESQAAKAAIALIAGPH